jgi:ribosome-associated translation inhibitor RaiA
MNELNELDFTMELNSDDLAKEVEYDLFTQAEISLKKLAEGHSDMTGAAINVRQPAPGNYEVTVVVYSRPDHVAATQKEADPFLALDEALTAVTRQIRERREKLKKRWEQPGNLPVEQEMIEVVTAEADIPVSSSTKGA